MASLQKPRSPAQENPFHSVQVPGHCAEQEKGAFGGKLCAEEDVGQGVLHIYFPSVYTYMATKQKHWPCNRLGRPFRDKGL